MGLLPGLCALVASCSADRGPGDADSPRASTSDNPTSAVHTSAELDSAARTVLSFLRGQASLDSTRLADTVVLYLTPEIGGSRATFSRAQLRDPAKWAIPLQGHNYTLVPPTTLPKLTTKVGRHFRCYDYPLSSVYPDLGRLPHVGTQLAPEEMGSCLQTWNITFVFDSTARPPRLVAAVYDQFEW